MLILLWNDKVSFFSWRHFPKIDHFTCVYKMIYFFTIHISKTDWILYSIWHNSISRCYPEMLLVLGRSSWYIIMWLCRKLMIIVETLKMAQNSYQCYLFCLWKKLSTTVNHAEFSSVLHNIYLQRFYLSKLNFKVFCMGNANYEEKMKWIFDLEWYYDIFRKK